MTATERRLATATRALQNALARFPLCRSCQRPARVSGDDGDPYCGECLPDGGYALDHADALEAVVAGLATLTREAARG